MKIIDKLSLERDPIIHFFFTFLVLSILYRVWFYLSLDGVIGIPLHSAKANFCLGLWSDTIIAVIFSGLLYLVKHGFALCKLPPGIFKQILRCLGVLFIITLLFFCALLFAIQKTLFVALFSGLTTDMLREAFLGLTIKTFSANITVIQWLFLMSPIVLFILFRFVFNRYLLRAGLFCLLPVMFIAIIYGYIGTQLPHYNKIYDHILTLNPLKAILNDYLLTGQNAFTRMKQQPSKKQLRSTTFIDPRFISKHKLPAIVKMNDLPKRWNVILIVLESTGYQYIFDKSQSNKLPMPFLKSLFDQGAVLAQHYAPGNSSPPGLFSIFSGLNPSPTPKRLEMRRNTIIPNTATFLGKTYHSFLVTPGPIDYYMPINFLKHGGLQLYGEEAIPLKNPRPRPPNYISEIDAMDFFTKKLRSTTLPFFAVYYSGAPHSPYFDYGKKWRILPDIKKNKDRYYNNLYFLDHQLQRIHDTLKQRHLLNDTIWVVVADHGEGFKQHQGSVQHGTALYSEQTHIPGLFYQPLLFPPQVVHENTSNTDILPTLLDAMGTPYNSTLIQGTSLVKPHKQQRYIFLYGVNDDMLASIDRHNIKLQVNFSPGTCQVYDLNRDENEQHPLDCKDHEQQLDDLIRYRNYQMVMLKQYNQRLLREAHTK